MRQCDVNDPDDLAFVWNGAVETAVDGWDLSVPGATAAEACQKAVQSVGFGATDLTFDVGLQRCHWKFGNGSTADGWVVQQCAVSPLDFEALGITSGQMTYVFSWGVAAVLGLWLLGYVIACGVQSINKA